MGTGNYYVVSYRISKIDGLNDIGKSPLKISNIILQEGMKTH